MKLEQQVQKLYNWAFVSNGIMSADKRIVNNTLRIEAVENYPCKDGCLFEKKEQEDDDMQDKKKSIRAIDIANYIQLAALFLIIYGMFFQ